ncbi:hypothetical protein COY28_06015, partial [Candidatus Woesearchaeota archaeon CG_4_10_14_0_2_um_filter_57_5]
EVLVMRVLREPGRHSRFRAAISSSFSSSPFSSFSVAPLSSSLLIASIIIMALLLASSLTQAVRAELPPAERIDDYVIDHAGVFSTAQADELAAHLRGLDQATGMQFVVFTEERIPEGTTLEERSLAIAEQNKLGQKGKDNGLLFYLATADRQFRWEVGYGLEGDLSAGWLGRMSRAVMVPAFQSGDFAHGITAGVAEVEAKAGINATIVPVTYGAASYSSGDVDPKVIYWALAIVIALAFIIAIATPGAKKRDDAPYIAAGWMLYGRPPRGGIGGFGGGGFGGFSGGGGGFGGGGFSGRF